MSGTVAPALPPTFRAATRAEDLEPLLHTYSLKPQTRRLLLALALLADEDLSLTGLHRSQIAVFAGISAQAVEIAGKELEARGIITRTRGGYQQRYTYQIIAPSSNGSTQDRPDDKRRHDAR